MIHCTRKTFCTKKKQIRRRGGEDTITNLVALFYGTPYDDLKNGWK
jgi:hypothetical protein